MKQTSPSSASSVAATTAFEPAATATGASCEPLFSAATLAPSVFRDFSCPPGPRFRPPWPRVLEPLVAEPPAWFEGGAPPRPRRRPPRPRPEESGAVDEISAIVGTAVVDSSAQKTVNGRRPSAWGSSDLARVGGEGKKSWPSPPLTDPCRSLSPQRRRLLRLRLAYIPANHDFGSAAIYDMRATGHALPSSYITSIKTGRKSYQVHAVRTK